MSNVRPTEEMLTICKVMKRETMSRSKQQKNKSDGENTQRLQAMLGALNIIKSDGTTPALWIFDHGQRCNMHTLTGTHTQINLNKQIHADAHVHTHTLNFFCNALQKVLIYHKFYFWHCVPTPPHSFRKKGKKREDKNKKKLQAHFETF